MPVHGVMLLHILCLVDVFFLAFYHSVRVNHPREAGWEHQQRFIKPRVAAVPPCQRSQFERTPCTLHRLSL